MKNDFVALLGIFLLAVIWSYSPKIGGYLIAIIVLGMLLQLNRSNSNGFSA